MTDFDYLNATVKFRQISAVLRTIAIEGAKKGQLQVTHFSLVSPCLPNKTRLAEVSISIVGQHICHNI